MATSTRTGTNNKPTNKPTITDVIAENAGALASDMASIKFLASQIDELTTALIAEGDLERVDSILAIAAQLSDAVESLGDKVAQVGFGMLGCEWEDMKHQIRQEAETR
jgi:hypothetical protein